jgi:threonine dehydratase
VAHGNEVMRVVRVSPEASADTPPILDAARLASARTLRERFPLAHLRPLSLVRAAELDAIADPSKKTRVWLAAESMQITGSFKIRGALLAMGNLAAKNVDVVAASAGNHGAAVAFAAKLLKMKAKVVVPATAPKVKCARIADGAEVVLSEADGYDEAEILAKRIAEESGAAFLSPYDDLDVIAGNGASLAFEIADALGKQPDCVVAPFGGGGLATGLACALPESRVWGVQSEASPAMAMSIEKNEAIEKFIPTTPTLAEGLEGGISKRAFERACRVVAGVVVVDEACILHAMKYAASELGLIIEGSAAAALAPLLEKAPSEICGGDVVVVLTGRNTDHAFGKTESS